MKNSIILFFICVCLLSVFYVTRDVSIQKQQKITIVATTSIIADAVKNIVGDCAQVYQLMGPGIDPHIYRARESDVLKLAQADIVFYHGLHLEGKMSQVLAGMYHYTKTIAVTDVLEKPELRSVDFDDLYDPHVWFDVLLWINVVEGIISVLMQHDAERAHVYQRNGEEYIKKMRELHMYIEQRVNSIAANKRILITAHDAFAYFGKAYGFEVVGLQGLSTDADINTKDIQKLSDYIVEKKVRALFVESSIPVRTLVAVQNAVAAKGWRVEIGGELYSDALGDIASQAGTYCGMIMHNIDTIIDSLGE